jgi:bacillopeptidase F
VKTVNRRRRSRRKNPWTKAVLFSLASLILIAFLVFFGLELLVKFSLFLESLSPPPANFGQSQKRKTRSLPPSLYPPPVATNAARLNLKGFSQPGQKVRLYLNGEKITDSTADKRGEFLFTNISLESGDNRLYAATVNDKGEEETFSTSYTVLFKNQPPPLEVLEPEDGAVYKKETNQTITVKGKTEADATVTLNDRLVVVQPNGEFSHPLRLNEGENHLKISARDPAGNETSTELTVTYRP